MNLIFQCKTLKEFKLLKKCIDSSVFNYDTISSNNMWFGFECESQTDLDLLEKELQVMIDVNSINGYFESED